MSIQAAQHAMASADGLTLRVALYEEVSSSPWHRALDCAITCGIIGRMSDKRAIARLRKLCLALPQVEERPFGGHTAPCWRVRDKLFVTTAADETWMTCKAPPGVQQALVGSDPDRFFVPRYSGKSGWIGIRLDVKPDWDEIAELIEESYRMTAPKKLVAELE